MPVSSQWFANPGSTYEIDQSIRFNDDDSAQLSKTYSGAGNRKTASISMWLKRANISTTMDLFGANSSNLDTIRFNSNDTMMIRVGNADSTTDRVFRDVGAWGHLFIVRDTTQSTSTNRLKAWWNNEALTFSTYSVPSQDTDTEFMNAVIHRIGTEGGGSSQFFDGYLAEIHVIDGTAKATTDFGEIDSDTGQWIPKEYTGSYGDNGFHIDGRDSSDLGDDESGEGNDYASSGLSTADQMSDSPTNNYSTLNPLSNGTGASPSDGNLKFSTTSSATGTMVSTIPVSSGKWYAEVTVTTGSANGALGIRSITQSSVTSNTLGNQTLDYSYRGNGQKFNSNTKASYGTAYTTNDVIGIALDLDAGTIKFLNDNSNQGNAYTGISGTFVFAVGDDHTSSAFAGTFNFGASSFTYTPPTGYKALNSANLPTPSVTDPSLYFQSTLYSGNGSTQSISNGGNSDLQPDLIWIKNRSAADSHVLTDAVRGVTKILSTDSTGAESTDADTVTAFASDGFALGADDKVNTSSENYVAWQWKEGSTPGFDIVTYTGTGSGANISHSLGVKPSVVIVKCRSDGSTHWIVNDWSGDYANKLKLNENEAASGSSGFITAATSSNFTLGTDSDVNGSSRTYVAYCFAEVEGFSKFGSYTGNGNADGPFVATGFAPSVIIFKNASAAYNWDIRDSKRDPLNPNTFYLSPSLNDAEATSSDGVDFLSNGFKYRSSGATANGSGNTIIYMAFAKTPFKTANAR